MLSNHISRTIEVFQRPPTQQTHSLECLVAVCVCVVDPSNIGLQLAQSSCRRRCRVSAAVTHATSMAAWRHMDLYQLHCGGGKHTEHATFKIAEEFFSLFLANLACGG